jgi:hypothetical protein
VIGRLAVPIVNRPATVTRKHGEALVFSAFSFRTRIKHQRAGTTAARPSGTRQQFEGGSSGSWQLSLKLIQGQGLAEEREDLLLSVFLSSSKLAIR